MVSFFDITLHMTISALIRRTYLSDLVEQIRIHLCQDFFSRDEKTLCLLVTERSRLGRIILRRIIASLNDVGSLCLGCDYPQLLLECLLCFGMLQQVSSGGAIVL